jgi:hypothetical protein
MARFYDVSGTQFITFQLAGPSVTTFNPTLSVMNLVKEGT